MQYMVAEVQYGGRITELEDLLIFRAYVDLWVTGNCFQENFCFVPEIAGYCEYRIPDCMEHQKHVEIIQKLAAQDVPPMFGLNNNADLTFRMKESLAMISTLLETMPKDADGGEEGKSLNEEVQEKVENDYLPMLPEDMVWLEVMERLRALKGPKGIGEAGNYQTLPLNVFLS